MMAPPGTPDAVIDKISKDAAEVIHQPDMQTRFVAQAAKPIGNTPQEAADFIASESHLWEGVIKTAGIKLGQ